jgi:hypothetical protein
MTRSGFTIRTARKSPAPGRNLTRYDLRERRLEPATSGVTERRSIATSDLQVAAAACGLVSGCPGERLGE